MKDVRIAMVIQPKGATDLAGTLVYAEDVAGIGKILGIVTPEHDIIPFGDPDQSKIDSIIDNSIVDGSIDKNTEGEDIQNLPKLPKFLEDSSPSIMMVKKGGERFAYDDIVKYIELMKNAPNSQPNIMHVTDNDGVNKTMMPWLTDELVYWNVEESLGGASKYNTLTNKITHLYNKLGGTLNVDLISRITSLINGFYACGCDPKVMGWHKLNLAQINRDDVLIRLFGDLASKKHTFDDIEEFIDGLKGDIYDGSSIQRLNFNVGFDGYFNLKFYSQSEFPRLRGVLLGWDGISNLTVGRFDCTSKHGIPLYVAVDVWRVNDKNKKPPIMVAPDCSDYVMTVDSRHSYFLITDGVANATYEIVGYSRFNDETIKAVPLSTQFNGDFIKNVKNHIMYNITDDLVIAHELEVVGELEDEILDAFYTDFRVIHNLPQSINGVNNDEFMAIAGVIKNINLKQYINFKVTDMTTNKVVYDESITYRSFLTNGNIIKFRYPEVSDEGIRYRIESKFIKNNGDLVDGTTMYTLETVVPRSTNMDVLEDALEDNTEEFVIKAKDGRAYSKGTIINIRATNGDGSILVEDSHVVTAKEEELGAVRIPLRKPAKGIVNITSTVKEHYKFESKEETSSINMAHILPKSFYNVDNIYMLSRDDVLDKKLITDMLEAEKADIAALGTDKYYDRFSKLSGWRIPNIDIKYTSGAPKVVIEMTTGKGTWSKIVVRNIYGITIKENIDNLISLNGKYNYEYDRIIRAGAFGEESYNTFTTKNPELIPFTPDDQISFVIKTYDYFGNLRKTYNYSEPSPISKSFEDLPVNNAAEVDRIWGILKEDIVSDGDTLIKGIKADIHTELAGTEFRFIYSKDEEALNPDLVMIDGRINDEGKVVINNKILTETYMFEETDDDYGTVLNAQYITLWIKRAGNNTYDKNSYSAVRAIPKKIGMTFLNGKFNPTDNIDYTSDETIRFNMKYALPKAERDNFEIKVEILSSKTKEPITAFTKSVTEWYAAHNAMENIPISHEVIDELKNTIHIKATMSKKEGVNTSIEIGVPELEYDITIDRTTQPWFEHKGLGIARMVNVVICKDKHTQYPVGTKFWVRIEKDAEFKTSKVLFEHNGVITETDVEYGFRTIPINPRPEGTVTLSIIAKEPDKFQSYIYRVSVIFTDPDAVSEKDPLDEFSVAVDHEDGITYKLRPVDVDKYNAFEEVEALSPNRVVVRIHKQRPAEDYTVSVTVDGGDKKGNYKIKPSSQAEWDNGLEVDGKRDSDGSIVRIKKWDGWIERTIHDINNHGEKMAAVVTNIECEKVVVYEHLVGLLKYPPGANNAASPVGTKLTLDIVTVGRSLTDKDLINYWTAYAPTGKQFDEYVNSINDLYVYDYTNAAKITNIKDNDAQDIQLTNDAKSNAYGSSEWLDHIFFTNGRSYGFHIVNDFTTQYDTTTTFNMTDYSINEYIGDRKKLKTMIPFNGALNDKIKDNIVAALNKYIDLPIYHHKISVICLEYIHGQDYDQYVGSETYPSYPLYMVVRQLEEPMTMRQHRVFADHVVNNIFSLNGPMGLELWADKPFLSNSFSYSPVNNDLRYAATMFIISKNKYHTVPINEEPFTVDIVDPSSSEDTPIYDIPWNSAIKLPDIAEVKRKVREVYLKYISEQVLETVNSGHFETTDGVSKSFQEINSVISDLLPTNSYKTWKDEYKELYNHQITLNGVNYYIPEEFVAKFDNFEFVPAIRASYYELPTEDGKYYPRYDDHVGLDIIQKPSPVKYPLMALASNGSISITDGKAIYKPLSYTISEYAEHRDWSGLDLIFTLNMLIVGYGLKSIFGNNYSLDDKYNSAINTPHYKVFDPNDKFVAKNVVNYERYNYGDDYIPRIINTSNIELSDIDSRRKAKQDFQIPDSLDSIILNSAVKISVAKLTIQYPIPIDIGKYKYEFYSRCQHAIDVAKEFKTQMHAFITGNKIGQFNFAGPKKIIGNSETYPPLTEVILNTAHLTSSNLTINDYVTEIDGIKVVPINYTGTTLDIDNVDTLKKYYKECLTAIKSALEKDVKKRGVNDVRADTQFSAENLTESDELREVLRTEFGYESYREFLDGEINKLDNTRTNRGSDVEEVEESGVRLDKVKQWLDGLEDRDITDKLRTVALSTDLENQPEPTPGKPAIISAYRDGNEAKFLVANPAFNYVYSVTDYIPGGLIGIMQPKKKFNEHHYVIIESRFVTDNSTISLGLWIDGLDVGVPLKIRKDDPMFGSKEDFYKAVAKFDTQMNITVGLMKLNSDPAFKRYKTYRRSGLYLKVRNLITRRFPGENYVQYDIDMFYPFFKKLGPNFDPRLELFYENTLLKLRTSASDAIMLQNGATFFVNKQLDCNLSIIDNTLDTKMLMLY